MRSIIAVVFTLAVFLPWPLAAQAVTGDIGVTGFSMSQFSVLDPAGGVSTGYGVGSFGGSGPATTQSILWDPVNPNDFIVGGFGFVGRATVTGPGSVSYSVLSTSVGEVTQMSWDANGQIVAVESGAGQILAIDPMTGSTTVTVPAGQPWGGANAGVCDPTTGDLYVGNSGNLYRYVPATGSATVLASGWGGGFVSGIALDPASTDLIVTVLGVNRVLRIDQAGTRTDLVLPGSIASPNSVAVDQNGNFVVGGNGGLVYRIPSGGGSQLLLGTVTGQGSSASGVSVVGGAAQGPPPLAVTGAPDGSLTLDLTGLQSGAFAGWMLVTQDVALPAGTGPFLGITPDALTTLLVTSFPAPTVGNPVHFLTGFPGFFPDAPFVFAPGTTTLLAGVTLDWVVLTYDVTAIVTGISNVVRVTF